MLRTVVTFVYIVWPLKLGAFSLEIEKYNIPFPESRDINISAFSNAFMLTKNVHFLYGSGGIWKLESYTFDRKKT